MNPYIRIGIILFLSLFINGCNKDVSFENNKPDIHQEDVTQEKITQREGVTDENLITLEKIKNLQNKYTDPDENIWDMIHIKDYLILVHKNFNYTIYDLKSDKSMLIEETRLLTENEIYIDDNKLSICLGNRIKIFSLTELELLFEKEYAGGKIDYVQISPHMKSIVYLNKNKELYYSDIDNNKPKLIKLQYNFEGSVKPLLPRFLDEDTILVELIGGYPTGTNLIKYNLKTNTQELLHIDDRVVGHTSYLCNSLDTSVLASEFICYIIDMTTFQVINSFQLSEQIKFIPEFNHDKNKLLYINSNNNIVVYDVNTGNKKIIEEEWSGGYLTWLFDDTSIFGSQIINNEKSFCFYDLENN